MRGSYYQREWLLEDIEQIRRYFPGAELLESVDTPFDIEAGVRGEARQEVAPVYRVVSTQAVHSVLRATGAFL